MLGVIVKLEINHFLKILYRNYPFVCINNNYGFKEKGFI